MEFLAFDSELTGSVTDVTDVCSIIKCVPVPIMFAQAHALAQTSRLVLSLSSAMECRLLPTVTATATAAATARIVAVRACARISPRIFTLDSAVSVTVSYYENMHD